MTSSATELTTAEAVLSFAFPKKIMTFQKPDGDIEIESSGCCCSPGERHRGQHTNSCTNWIRFRKGKWTRLHSLSTAMTFAGAAETVEECFYAVMGDKSCRLPE